MILGVDHVGVMTDDPDGVGEFMTALGLRKSDAGVAGDYGVACEFWGAPEGSGIEVVSPVREGSAVSDLLGRSGPGLFHIAFVADNIELEFDRLRRRGFAAVDSRPCRGARAGMKVVFMYLRKPAGLLIELVQYDGQPVSLRWPAGRRRAASCQRRAARISLAMACSPDELGCIGIAGEVGIRPSTHFTPEGWHASCPTVPR